MRRRTLLSAVVAGGGALTAGCLYGSPDPRLGAVVATNKGTSDHTVHAEVKINEKVVAKNAATAKGSSNGSPTETVVVPPDAVTRDAAYTVGIRVDDEAQWTEQHYAHRTDDCFTVVAEINGEGTLRFSVRSNDEYCNEMKTTSSD